MRLLLVEDNARLSALVSAALAKAGFEVDTVSTAGDASAALRSVGYAAMILDLGLPDEDGLAMLKRTRAAGEVLPVLILTTRGGLQDRVRGLHSGADDYLVKPFSQEELQARIRALLRRPGGLLGDSLKLGNVCLDTVSRELTIAGSPHLLSVRETAVLEMLLRRSGRVVPKNLAEDHLLGFGRCRLERD